MSLHSRIILVAGALTLIEAGLATAEAAPARQPRTDLYGDPLPDGAIARFGTTRWKHTSGVSGLAFSPDGKTIASVGDRVPRLWEVATSKELRRFVGHESRVNRVLFFPDGKTLVTGGQDGTIRFWNVATGKEMRRLVNPTKGVTALALAPDGKTLASGGRNGDPKIYLWDTTSGKLLRSWAAHAADVWVLAFTPDGKLLLSGGESDGQIVNGAFENRPSDNYGAAAWDPASGKKRYQIGRIVRVAARRTPGDQDNPNYRTRYENHVDPERVAALAFSPDGKLLATGGYDPPQQFWTVRLWDAATGKERRLDCRKSDAKAIAFSPDGRLLAAQDDRSLVFWDVVRGTRLVKFEDAFPPDVRWNGMRSLVFSPDGGTLAAGCGNGELKLWRVARRAPAGKPCLTECFAPRGHQSHINTIAVSPDGRLAVSAGEGESRLWEPGTGTEVRTLEGYFGRIGCAAFSPNGKIVATGHQVTGFVYLWDAASGNQLCKLEGHQHNVVSVSFLGDGKTLVSHGVGSDLIFWDVATGKAVRKLDDRPKGLGLRPALSPDSRTIGTTDTHGLYLWEAETGEQRRRLAAGDSQAGIFSPDGRVVASVGEEVRLWDVSSGVEIGRLRGGLRKHHHYFNAPIAYSPDGRFLAAAEFVEGESATHLWSMETGKDERLDGGQGQVTAIAFSPGGRHFLTAGEDRTVLVWDVARVAGEPEKPPPLTAAQVRELTTTLRGDNPLRAFRAFHCLSRSPAKAVEVLRDRLRPVAAVDAERLARLLRQLDSDDFVERERAMASLRELGQPAERALKQALKADPSPEMRKRIGQLLEEREQARKGRLTDWSVRLLERVGTKEARILLERLAGGAAGAPLTEDAAAALKRLDKLRRAQP